MASPGRNDYLTHRRDRVRQSHVPGTTKIVGHTRTETDPYSSVSSAAKNSCQQTFQFALASRQSSRATVQTSATSKATCDDSQCHVRVRPANARRNQD